MKFKIEGNHIFTFYYGEKHLVIKANNFLSKGLKKNEKCFYSFKEEKAKEILKDIKQADLRDGQLSYLNMEKIIRDYLKQGKKTLKKTLNKLSIKAKKEGYKRIIILNDPLVLKKILDDEKLILWEQELDKILMEINNILVLCFYNARCLINSNGKPNEKKLIKQVLKIHPSLLSAEEIYQIKDEFKVFN